MTSLLRSCTVALALAASAVACTPPEEAPVAERQAADAPLASSTPDPSAIALAAEFDELVASVSAARDRIEGGVEAGSLEAAHAAGRDTLAQLLVDPPIAGGSPPEATPLFPSETQDRGADVAEDQLTITASVARDAGAAGSTVLAMLRDPVAGDLGSWLRDPEGVLLMVGEAVATTGGLDALDLAVMELPGLGTRAIAWALLTARAAGLEDARTYAERGAAHLEVVLTTLDTIAADVAEHARVQTDARDGRGADTRGTVDDAEADDAVGEAEGGVDGTDEAP